MKKADKIKHLHDAAGTYRLCRCYFQYDENYWYFYILDYSEKFIFGIEEDDFILDGFQIRKVSQMKKIELKDDICVKINQEKKILENVQKPEIDLQSWKSVFQSVKKLGCFVMIQNEKDDGEDGFMYLGKIKKIKKTFVKMTCFDADGNRLDDVEIPYKKITSVTFGDRYSKIWQEYLMSVGNE